MTRRLLNARVMSRLHRDPSAHTEWCARDHRCNLYEHRSAEIIADLPGHGRAVVTRVRAGGTEYAEIRARVPLHSTDTGARWQVGTALRLIRELLASVAIRQGVLQGRPERREVSR